MRTAREACATALGITLVSLVLVRSAAAGSFSVVFLGNSHTYFNDLPGLVQSLAEAGGDTVIAASSTPGGCSFSYPPNAHLLTPSSIALLEAGGWDYVVLQEQSQIPCIPYLRDSYMYPGAMALDSIAHAHTPCCVTVFYMTWGHNHHGPWVETFGGFASPEFADYDAMQDSVTAAYVRLADSLSTPVAPVGVAWQNAYHGGIPLDLLFNADQYHPALAGSYLAACVFYATLFQKSPLGLSFNAGLDQSLVEMLQAVADSTVMPYLSNWNVDPAMPYAAFEFTWGFPPLSRYSPMQDDRRVRGTPQTDQGGDTPTGDSTDGTRLESLTLALPKRGGIPCR
ncbi:MAG: hypothetical protein MUE60_07960 [Candidatus Eisenbacteria bacterium]|nr:hypothetical protein [Candidatus Eisenbacteria bacterium]